MNNIIHDQYWKKTNAMPGDLVKIPPVVNKGLRKGRLNTIWYVDGPGPVPYVQAPNLRIRSHSNWKCRSYGFFENKLFIVISTIISPDVDKFLRNANIKPGTFYKKRDFNSVNPQGTLVYLDLFKTLIIDSQENNLLWLDTCILKVVQRSPK